MMRYVSLFSGIEAATVAWHPLGWEPVAFAEIEPFPSAVLSHHYPDVPNLGDITKVDWSEYAGVDVLVGGSPCQSFSVAGLRQGLRDPRGNLALEYLRAVDEARPRWVVWENVPGVLSSNGGRDFGAFLGGLAQLGYGFCYRVLDAQYVRVQPYARAVPQRRRRVFVVGHLGDWRRAAAVLLERESLRGHPAPRRETGEGSGRDVAAGILCGRTGRAIGAQEAGGGHLIPEVCTPLTASFAKHGGASAGKDGYPHNLIPEVAHTLTQRHDSSEDGTGRNTPKVQQGYAVRRLTPLECERLQGFPDDYTNVPYRGKQAADSPRYKAIGNSMATNVMRFIGERIDAVQRNAPATCEGVQACDVVQPQGQEGR